MTSSVPVKKLVPAAIALGLFLAGSVYNAQASGYTTSETQTTAIFYILVISFGCLLGAAWLSTKNKTKKVSPPVTKVTKSPPPSVKTRAKPVKKSRRK